MPLSPRLQVPTRLKGRWSNADTDAADADLDAVSAGIRSTAAASTAVAVAAASNRLSPPSLAAAPLLSHPIRRCRHGTAADAASTAEPPPMAASAPVIAATATGSAVDTVAAAAEGVRGSVGGRGARWEGVRAQGRGGDLKGPFGPRLVVWLIGLRL